MAKFPDLKHLECLAWTEAEKILSEQKRKIWSLKNETNSVNGVTEPVVCSVWLV